MDFIRSCYASSMRLYPDRPDVLTAGSWHFCAPGAIPVPYCHAFTSSVWDYDQTQVAQLGEQKPRGAWSRGNQLPQFQGRHFCGSIDAWRNGIPYADRPGLALDAQGVPLCCKPVPYSAAIVGQCCGCGQVIPL